MTEGSMVQNERGGRTADCVTPVRHPMLTVLRNLGWAALVSQGVPLLLRSIRLLDSGSVITLYMLLLFVASGLAVVLGLTRPIVEDDRGRIRRRWGCYLLSIVGRHCVLLFGSGLACIYRLLLALGDVIRTRRLL